MSRSANPRRTTVGVSIVGISILLAFALIFLVKLSLSSQGAEADLAEDYQVPTYTPTANATSSQQVIREVEVTRVVEVTRIVEVVREIVVTPTPLSTESSPASPHVEEPIPTATLIPLSSSSFENEVAADQTQSSVLTTANTNANLRSGPGTDFALVGAVTTGQMLDLVATNQDGTWYQTADGRWIAAFLVANAPNTLPIAKDIPQLVTYDSLARNTEQYIGHHLIMSGKVFQVAGEDGAFQTLLVSVTENVYFWDDRVLLTYEGPRLLEDDIIVFVARVEGRYTYTAVRGDQITVPHLTAISVVRE